MAEYEYQGDGAGVPGLPHRITDEQAEALGVAELLQQALKVGAYRKVRASADAEPARNARSGYKGRSRDAGEED
jgi:hypothetical protein